MDKRIAICILHYKKPRLTVACLESLKKQTYKNFHVYLLVQGAAQEDYITLHNVYDDWEQITITDSNTNLGFAEGNNILIRKALKDQAVTHVITLNNDTEVVPEFLERIQKPFIDDRIGTVQPRMMRADDHSQIDNLGIELTMSGITFNIKTEGKLMFAASAGAACYSRALLENVSMQRQVIQGFQSEFIYDYFDPEYFAYAEDLDLGFRALHAGYKTALASDAICYHVGSASTSVMSDFAISHTYRNIYWTLYKNLPTLLIIKYGCFITLGFIMLWFHFLLGGKLPIFCRSIRETVRRRKEFSEKRKYILSRSIIKTEELEAYITKQLIDTDYIKNIKKNPE